MFENQVIVSSAISTFNNAALWEPGFLWTAILALPLFVLGWIMSPQIIDRFLPVAKTRDAKIALPIVAILFVWVFAYGNFEVLRDGTSLIGILNAVILWLGAMYLSRRYYESNFRLSQFAKSKKLKRVLDLFAAPAVVAIAGIFAYGAGRDEFILQTGAVAIGILAGYILNWRKTHERDPKTLIAAMMLLGSMCLIMQPEFFRFGQMANLSLIHLLFLCGAAVALGLYFALAFTRPRGWFPVAYYNRSKILMRTGLLFVLALLLITESAPVYATFFIAVMVVAILGALHSKNEEHVKKTKPEIWLASVALFGILASLPALTFIAIVMWRQASRDGFLGRIGQLL